ncbi:MAG: HTH domain-containing protein, partial [Clostridiales bacterium]|nr:HTH domain-containing protein [Clostridiales bacterium]
MNQRTNTIIHMLNDAKEPLSLAELATHFQVSQRTIRNDLNEINATLQQHQLKTLTLKGGRVLLPDDFDQSIPLLVSGDFYTYKLSREERKLVAAAILVNATGYVTLSEIADHLFVSRATIINDLDSIKAYIQQAGLEVQSHASRGLRVEGPESVKRFFLLELLAPGAQEGREVQQDVVSNLVSVQAGNRVI